MREDARQRAEALSLVDAQVARTIRTLRETGQLDNTYVVFTSDNGYFLGEHRMRQGKILPYEPSLRVPLMIRGPGIPAGQVRSDPFTMIDFAPTILAAAGIRAPASVDGESLLEVARSGDRGWNRGILTETGPRAVSQDAEESDNFLRRRVRAVAAAVLPGGAHRRLPVRRARQPGARALRPAQRPARGRPTWWTGPGRGGSSGRWRTSSTCCATASASTAAARCPRCCGPARRPSPLAFGTPD